MIPIFPKFKHIEASDREVVEVYTRAHPPFSDFDFTSMYAWDVEHKILLSQLHGNLVIRFTDYVTSELFYSVLGTNLLDETVETLIQFARTQGVLPTLKLIPSVVVERLNAHIFNVQEARDQYDYIVSVYRLHTYSGEDFAAKRRQVSLFSRRNSEYDFRQLDLSDAPTKESILHLFSVWLVNKDEQRSLEDEHEYTALQRCLASPTNSFITTGLFFKKTLAAFWILENVGNGYAMSHFEKADASYTGIFPFMKQKTADVLHAHSIVYVNLEQDLGISGLRKNKESYAPEHFLKKFTINLH